MNLVGFIVIEPTRLKERKVEQQKGQQYKMRFLDNEDHEKLKLKGKEEDRSINWLINQAIKEFLNKESAKA
ncbi:MAG TPA: hypothetical protein DCM33_01565 [Acinetobacter radioresistens]|nr:hypothetical protein [Acinetobacter radioresistens]